MTRSNGASVGPPHYFDTTSTELTSLCAEVDVLHQMVVWDISQNIHLVKTLHLPGVSCCITPGGKNFLSSGGRSMLGYEKLLLQGIPPDRLLLGRETEVQLSDLAGNAMVMPVISAAIRRSASRQPARSASPG